MVPNATEVSIIITAVNACMRTSKPLSLAFICTLWISLGCGVRSCSARSCARGRQTSVSAQRTVRAMQCIVFAVLAWPSIKFFEQHANPTLEEVKKLHEVVTAFETRLKANNAKIDNLKAKLKAANSRIDKLAFSPRASRATAPQGQRRPIQLGGVVRDGLTPEQLLPTSKWVKRRPPETSVLVQVGANTHRKNAGDPDPGPSCVQLGWRSILLEPVPNVFRELQRTYQDRTSARLQLVNAAVCPESPVEPCSAGVCACHLDDICLRSSPSDLHLISPCAHMHAHPHASDDSLSSCHLLGTAMAQEMWYVDTTNATGNWGSNHSDARCLSNSGYFGWVEEIASLDKKRVFKSSSYLQHSRNSAKRCAACSQELGRPLPSNCLAKMIHRNIRRVNVHCFCMGQEQEKTLRLRGQEKAVTLLIVDAEGFDLNVLQQYPFGRLPTWRVVFEAKHMSRQSFKTAAELLGNHSYRHVTGSHGAYLSEWHHKDAP